MSVFINLNYMKETGHCITFTDGTVLSDAENQRIASDAKRTGRIAMAICFTALGAWLAYEQKQQSLANRHQLAPLVSTATARR